MLYVNYISMQVWSWASFHENGVARRAFPLQQTTGGGGVGGWGGVNFLQSNPPEKCAHIQPRHSSEMKGLGVGRVGGISALALSQYFTKMLWFSSLIPFTFNISPVASSPWTTTSKPAGKPLSVLPRGLGSNPLTGRLGSSQAAHLRRNEKKNGRQQGRSERFTFQTSA